MIQKHHLSAKSHPLCSISANHSSLSLHDSQSQLRISGDDWRASRSRHSHPAPDHRALRVLPLALRPQQQEQGHREQR